MVVGERIALQVVLRCVQGCAGCGGAAWPKSSPEAGLLPSLEVGCCHFGCVCVLFSPRFLCKGQETN